MHMNMYSFFLVFIISPSHRSTHPQPPPSPVLHSLALLSLFLVRPATHGSAFGSTQLVSKFAVSESGSTCHSSEAPLRYWACSMDSVSSSPLM